MNIKFPDGIRYVVFIKFSIHWIFLLLLAGTVIVEALTDQLLEGNQWPSDLIHWKGALIAKNVSTIYPIDPLIFSVSGIRGKFRNSVLFIIMAAFQIEIPGCKIPHSSRELAQPEVPPLPHAVLGRSVFPEETPKFRHIDELKLIFHIYDMYRKNLPKAFSTSIFFSLLDNVTHLTCFVFINI